MKSSSHTSYWSIFDYKRDPDNVVLNNTFAELDRDDFNDTAPTSTNFAVGTHTSTNNSGHTYIAYCFSEVAGYSKFGVWTAVGDTNGSYVATGFQPAWIMAKQISGSGGNWFITDYKRETFNVNADILDANLSDDERNADIFDFLSNGFKIRLGLGTGERFIYLAFAKSPFKNSRAR